MLSWWKGEDNLDDSVGVNPMVWWRGEGYCAGVVGNAIAADYTDSPMGAACRIADPTGVFDFDPTSAFKIEFYIRLSSDVSKIRDFYVLSKNYITDFDYGIRILDGDIGITIGTTTYYLGGSLAYDDAWSQLITITYDNGYWRISIGDDDVTTDFTQHLITNAHTLDQLILGAAYPGDYYACKFDIDEIKISKKAA